MGHRKLVSILWIGPRVAPFQMFMTQKWSSESKEAEHSSVNLVHVTEFIMEKQQRGQQKVKRWQGPGLGCPPQERETSAHAFDLSSIIEGKICWLDKYKPILVSLTLAREALDPIEVREKPRPHLAKFVHVDSSKRLEIKVRCQEYRSSE